MKIIYWILFLLICSAPFFAEKAAVFPDLRRPQHLIVDKDRLFIPDYPEIHIYSLKDFNLIKKFGKEGQGPGEFAVSPRRFKINVQPAYLFVNCDNRIFYFTREGSLIKEINTRGIGYFFAAFKDKLVGRKGIQENNIMYTPLFLFDGKLNPVKELSRIKAAGSDNKIRAFHRSFNVEASKEKIFVTLGTEFVVKIFDYNGKLLHVINKETPGNRVRIKDSHKKDYDEYMKVASPVYTAIKNMIVFPEYFPAVRDRCGLHYDYHKGDEKLYVITLKMKDEKTECFVFTVQGKFLKKVYLPLLEKNAARLDLSPLDINDGKLYQLIENEETEEYELHVSEIQ